MNRTPLEGRLQMQTSQKQRVIRRLEQIELLDPRDRSERVEAEDKRLRKQLGLIEMTETAMAQFTAAGLRYEVIDSQVTLTQNGQVIGA
jgi:hypothetical protein